MTEELDDAAQGADGTGGGREARFAAAVRLYLAFRGAGRADATAYLSEHEDVRELLEPMLRPAPEAEDEAGRPFGEYRLLRELGRGGMGVVHEALQPRLGRRVALKVLQGGAATSPVAAARFQREVRLVARLSHPCLVPVFDAGAVDGAPFYAMELVEGRSLTEGLAAWRRAGLPAAAAAVGSGARALLDGGARPGTQVEAALDVVLQAAAALEHAHAAGIVHRDVKPGNLLLRADGRVFLSDFGIARPIDGEPTLTGEFAGTPHYMAPEQARGEAVDHRADVFALGAVLFEMVTLARPFAGETALDVLDAVRRADAPDPRWLNPALGADLAAVIGKAMARAPGERYATMAAFAADLRALRDGGDVAARPPSRWLRLQRWARREPWRAVAAAGALLAIAAGLAATSWFTRSLFVESQRTAEALAKVRRLSLGVRLETAERTAAAAFAGGAPGAAALERWLQQEAAPLAAELAPLRVLLAELRGQAAPWTDADREADRTTHPRFAEWRQLDVELGLWQDGHRPLAAELLGADRAALQRRRDEAAAALAERRTWRFADPEQQFLHDQVAVLIGRLLAFAEAPDGAVAHARAELEQAARRDRHWRERGEAAWRTAVAAIAAEPRYGGLHLRPDPELLPLGPDPASGLHEFLHLRSCAPDHLTAERRDGRLVVDEALGIVFVLVPGGTATIGAQPDPQYANHEAGAGPSDGPVRRLQLEPFLLGKFEVTQSQWQRLAGDNPSRLRAGTASPWQRFTAVHPVESVPYDRAVAVLAAVGCGLPTEAQWEYACRAGDGVGPWSFGERTAAPRFANFADASCARCKAPFPCEGDLDDGTIGHAPVGSYLPNGFGLHDLHGNVAEPCAGAPLGGAEPRAGDGLCAEAFTNRGYHPLRGGGHTSPLADLRTARRETVRGDFASGTTGVRAARAVAIAVPGTPAAK